MEKMWNHTSSLKAAHTNKHKKLNQITTQDTYINWYTSFAGKTTAQGTQFHNRR